LFIQLCLCVRDLLKMWKMVFNAVERMLYVCGDLLKTWRMAVNPVVECDLVKSWNIVVNTVVECVAQCVCVSG